MLENKGVDLGFQKKVYANVFCIMSNTLGNHLIRRFNANFSLSTFFCSYCMMTRSEFEENYLNKAEIRRPVSYHASLQQKLQANCLDSKPGKKRDSVFIELQYFHFVLDCHLVWHMTYFEGTLQFDVILFVMHLMNLKWFTLKFLNHKITSFRFHAYDCNSWPPVISKDSVKLSSNASVNYCFLRYFLIFVFVHVADTENCSRKLIICLKQIVEICVSSKFTKTVISELKYLSADYLHL